MRTVLVAILMAATALSLMAQRGAFGGGGFAPGAAAPPAQGRGAQGPAIGVVEGIVQTAERMQPIEQVTVSLQTPGAVGPAARTVVTDGTGRFSFQNVPVGNYAINAQREGYFAVTASTLIPPASVTMNGILNPDQPTANLVVTMVPGGVITGRVQDPNGMPAANIQVGALQKTFQSGHMTLRSLKTAVTDDRGEYRLWGLPPGEYYVRGLVRPVTALQRVANRETTITTYYPSSPDTLRASTLPLTGGSELAADLRMLQGTPIRISGRTIISDPGVQGTSSFFLVPRNSGLFDINEVRAQNLMPGQTTGDFQIQASRPGPHDLVYVFQARNPAAPAVAAAIGDTYVGRVEIDIRSADIEGLNLTASHTFSLDIRFNAGADPTLERQIPAAMTLLSKDPLLAVTVSPINAQIAAPATPAGTRPATRTFMRITEGQYVLDSNLALLQDAYIADIRHGAGSILEDGIIRVDNRPPEPVEVVLARPGATIQGVVQGPSNAPAPNAFVVLVPEGSRRQNLLLYRRATAASDGRFTLRGLTPGRYKVFAWSRNPGGVERDPEFLSKYEQSASSIILNAGAAISDLIVPLSRD